MNAFPNKPLWFEQQRPRPPLHGDIHTDVAIVGAGYTGLWTAYYLLKQAPGLRIAILERQNVGFGASGRNGGWASAIFPISLHKVEQLYSHSAAIALQLAMNDTVDEIGRALHAEGIDADFAKQGFLSLARSKPQLERVRRAVQSSVQFGLPGQWEQLSASDASRLVGATGVLGGLYTPHCALVHPGKLVRGLARTVESLGAVIYENTAVLGIHRHRVETNHGIVRAPVVLRATEAFTREQPGRERTIVPLYSLVTATEPLPLQVRQSLNLQHRIAFNDMRHLRIYAQMTAEGRLVFGGRGAPYHFGSMMSPDYEVVDGVHRKIIAALNDLFPALRGVGITHRWGGALGIHRDWCPSVGLDHENGLAWAGGYAGDGVATSNLSGRILSNLILGKDDDINDLPIVNHRSPIWEREPMRWFGVNFGLAAAAFSDKEERLTQQPSTMAKVLETLTGAH